VVFAIFVIPVILYVASLKLSPWVLCSNCRTNLKGRVATYAHHVCPKCKGTGQQLRSAKVHLRGAGAPTQTLSPMLGVF
jgi:hypothetical protein